jgi:hypothetical protein
MITVACTGDGDSCDAVEVVANVKAAVAAGWSAVTTDDVGVSESKDERWYTHLGKCPDCTGGLFPPG